MQSRPSRMSKSSRDWLEDTNINSDDNSDNILHVLSEPLTPHIVLSTPYAQVHIIQPHERETIVIPLLQMRILRHREFQ